jgi:hypothetical protein
MECHGGIMSQHKIEREKKLDRKRRRREKSLKLRAKVPKALDKKK